MDDDLIEQILHEQMNGDQRDDEQAGQYSVDDLLNEPSELNKPEEKSEDKLQTPSNNNHPDEQQETPKPKTKRESSSNKNKITIPDNIQNPIDVINFIEIDHYKNLSLDNSFPLRKYKETSNYKINSLEFEPLNLSNDIFSATDTLYTAMHIRNDFLYLGTSSGDIHIFSFKTEAKVKSLITPKEAKQIPVNCIDLSDDSRFLFCGHENGIVCMYDITTGKCKTVVNNVHFNSCINLKFYKREEKLYHYFSSDVDGNVFRTTIKDGVFSYKYESSVNIYTHYNNPTFLIKIINFTPEERQRYDFLKGLAQAIIFATCSHVYIYTLEPEIRKLFEFERPNYLGETTIPDVSYGIGKPPVSFSVKTEDVKSQILLCISWGKVIYVFLLPICSTLYSEPVQIGYFINAYNIHRSGFLAGSLIFFFDEQKFVKVIDSRQVNIGRVKIADGTGTKGVKDIIVPQDNSKAELDPGRLIDPDIKFQSLFKDKSGQTKRIFTNFIVEDRNVLYLLAKKKLYTGRLLNWGKCLKNLGQNEEWMNLLVTGIEIYQARNPSLADIPPEEKERKEVVGKYLTEQISKYVLSVTRKARLDGLPTGLEDYQDQGEIALCIDIAIEFCIEIERIDYLLSQVEPVFDEKDYTNLFLEKLEPFILADKILKVDLGKEIIQKIAKLYLKEKNYSMLSQILIHMNVMCLNEKTFLDSLESYGIITPSIYVYTNVDKQDYFTPMKKIFEYFSGAEHIISYDGDFKKFCQQTGDLNEIKSNKEYYAYMIFWYFKWFLSRKKFPDSTKEIDTQVFTDNLCPMTYWYLSHKVIEALNIIDSETYFQILGRIFGNKTYVDILNEKAKDTDFKMDNLAFFISENQYVSSIDTVSLIDYIVNMGENLSNKSLIYMYEFIAHCSYQNNISRLLALKTAGYLLENYSTYILEVDDNEKLYRICKDVINLFKNENEFTEDDYFCLLGQTKHCPLDPVKLFLYKKSNSYRQCLELFLNPDSKLENKVENLFEFINESLTNLQKKNDSQFTTFKNEIMIRIVDIGNMSPEHLSTLVDTWFDKDKKQIINQLEKDPRLQLQYVELEVDKINANLKENENNIEGSEDMAPLLKLHIQLLCILQQYDKILPSLQKNSLYPIDEVLSLCNTHKVVDAAIYLYQVKGSPEEGLKLAISILDENFTMVTKNLKDKDFNNENHFILLLDDFSANIKQCIQICEKNDQKYDDLWFNLLNKLYLYFGIINPQDKASESLLKQHMNLFKDIEFKLSREIKNLLEKMCSFVSIKKIMDNVTENYKNAGIKEFKEILTQMLGNYNNLTKIYQSAKELLCNSVLFNEKDLIKNNVRGNEFEIEKCDECNKYFEKVKRIPEKILVFSCGHLCHDKCAAIENDWDTVCSVCRRNEVESSIITSEEKVIKKEETEEEENRKDEVEDDVPYENREYFNKIRDFDRVFSEKYNSMMDDTIGLKDEKVEKSSKNRV